MTLPWWDWLTMTKLELREAGVDPEERFGRTGHRRHFSKVWACSVGYWVLAEPREIMSVCGLDPKDAKDRSRYDMFKSRWRLASSRTAPGDLDSTRSLSARRLLLAESAALEMQLAMNGHGTYTAPVPPGEAAKLVASDLKILPMEAMLYRHAVDRVLEENELTWRAYFAIPEVERPKLWHGVHTWLPPRIRTQYALGNG
jgi:hypothetical protein